MRFLTLVFLALTACSSSPQRPVTPRKVSSAKFSIPHGTRVLFECGSSAVIVVNDPLESAQQPNINDGTSRVVKALRKIGPDSTHLTLVTAHGQEELTYGEEISGDLHKGARWIFAEDISWPRGRWNGKSSQVLFHPDGSHEFEGTHPIDEEVELLPKGGEPVRCLLADDLRMDCC